MTKGRGELVAVGGRLVVFRTSGDGVVELWLERENRASRVVGCRFGAGEPGCCSLDVGDGLKHLWFGTRTVDFSAE